VVTDDQGVTPVRVGGDTDGDDELDLNETWIYEATGIAVAGDYENVGTATGDYGTTTKPDTDPSSYFGADPKIAIVKLTNGVDGYLVGLDNFEDDITWSYAVTNIGNVDLVNVDVVDDAGTPGLVVDDVTVGTIGLLAPGQTTTLTITVADASWPFDVDWSPDGELDGYTNWATASGDGFVEGVGLIGQATASDSSSIVWDFGPQ
jgi:hypothetical protein